MQRIGFYLYYMQFEDRLSFQSKNIEPNGKQSKMGKEM